MQNLSFVKKTDSLTIRTNSTSSNYFHNQKWIYLKAFRKSILHRFYSYKTKF